MNDPQSSGIARVLRPDEVVEIDIADVAFGGDGVGRCDGWVVFVPMTLPGERVRVRIVARRKRMLFAEPVEVLSPSPHRVMPFCRYYGQCGGCQYQHVAYDEQLRLKWKQLADIMARLGQFEESLPIEPMLPSPRQRQYRNRIDLHPCGDDRYGFCHRDNSRRIFPLEGCPLFELDQDWSHLTLRRPACLLVVRTHSGRPYCYFKDDRNIVQSGPFDLESLEPVHDGGIRFEVGSLTFTAHYGGFFQVNGWILPAFVETIISMAGLHRADTVLDVYCGVGIFGLAAAPHVARVLGVELSEECIAFARKNAEAMGACNTTFSAAPAEEYLAGLVQSGTNVDVAIVDPPRNGLTNKAVSALKKLKPPRIVYVSCGPDTFARDARKLVDAGYVLARIQPLDLFPQTKHFELVARFDRSSVSSEVSCLTQ